jgi:predicted nucleotidyltransferase
LIRQVRTLAEKADLITGNTRWCLFGSALRDPVRAADVDLLVVCQSHSDADVIRRNAGKIASCKPVDLSILTKEEEAETSFVVNQRCIQVFPACG